MCVICSCQVKSEILWATHLQSRKHKDMVAALKSKKSQPQSQPQPQPALPSKPGEKAENAGKRKISDDVDVSSMFWLQCSLSWSLSVACPDFLSCSLCFLAWSLCSPSFSLCSLPCSLLSLSCSLCFLSLSLCSLSYSLCYLSCFFCPDHCTPDCVPWPKFWLLVYPSPNGQLAMLSCIAWHEVEGGNWTHPFIIIDWA